MSKFKIGDRVIVKAPEGRNQYWNGATGTVIRPKAGSFLYTQVEFDADARYADGSFLKEPYRTPGIGAGVDEVELELLPVEQETELQQLRKFKADVIEKYPELGYTDEQHFILSLLNEYCEVDSTTYHFNNPLALLFVKAIEFGRNEGK